MIDALFKYYLSHQNELVKLYNNKYIVITTDGVAGAYDSLDEGYSSAMAKYGKGNFMVQLCTEGEEAYSQRYFTSRVAF
ncbi:MAG: hypothetical protein LUD72_02785, partial [Bacteroidales bacterium]|nr:hypothetical protein [Bacteroidales bacterium]